MTADFLTATRTFYDAIASDYAERFRSEYDKRPVERAMLEVFAERVGAGGEVADLGCGPGRVTGRLAGLGLSVFGLDLSASMLAIARRENPELRFVQGSMLELEVADEVLDGVLCWYSSIHTPDDRLPDLFREFRRVLRPGGHLLLAFQVGDVARRHENPWGHRVTLDFLRRRPEEMTALLADAGFTLYSSTVREPDPELNELSPQAFLLAEL
ncbi:class I SAM-dependent methyltransferase [Streptomyces sp. NPDC101234]|uniref:class I SAM-dependent methyltransferase n=1 Tax=Streptomyces sp. NPDC101234 TaxID=3366138 RepID=UPI00381F8C18